LRGFGNLLFGDGLTTFKEIMESKKPGHYNLRGENITKGFTLIEVLLAVAVIALLASIISVGVRHAREKAKTSRGLQWSQNVHSLLGPYCEAWWNFDDGTASDVSGNGNKGTIHGGAYFTDETPNYMLGKSLSFDGTNYVDCGNGPSLNITDAITIEVWVKPANAPLTNRGIVGKNDGDSYKYYYGIGTTWGTGYRGMVKVGGNHYSSPPVSLSIGQWSHLVMTYDGETLRFYVNGKLASQNTDLSGKIKEAPTEHVYINYSSPPRWEGLIDEVRIYSQALPEQAIREHYLAGLGRHQKEIALAERQR